jgi:hypothetical protein
MDNSLKEILEEFESLKGQFVITSGQDIERLVAIGEDDEDYYYVTYNGRKLTFSSAVGRVMPLKGYLRDEDYFELRRLARLNHFDQSELWGSKSSEETKEFNEKHKTEMMSLKEPDRFLTEVCWELN